MHGKSVSPLIRVRYPVFSVWYQMFNSQGAGVSTVEMKSTASCATSTMYSLAPIPSKGGTSSLGSALSRVLSPQPEYAKPTTAPWDWPHFRIGRSQLGHSSIRVVSG